ncbi:hypothetical protein M422DRAFT_82525, partial [Sphaerobolus stellatus SS14]
DTKPGCIFCNVNRSNGFDVILEEGNVVVFRDRDPSAREHLLVVPLNHIESVKELEQEDIPLIQEMKAAGHRALDSLPIQFPPEMRRLGFHIPPATSVYHLHLHVHGLPYKSTYRKMKYPIVEGRNGNTKGFSWFVEADQSISILRNGKKIDVLPC